MFEVRWCVTPRFEVNKMSENMEEESKVELADIMAAYIMKRKQHKAKEEKYTALVEKRKKQLEWAEKRAGKHYVKSPSWIDELLKPIAEEMEKQMPDRYYEILGPFGMDAVTAIHFYRKELPEGKKLIDNNCISITFVPFSLEEGKLGLKDYTKNTHTWAEGTIGEMNDMNYPTIPMKETIDELMEWLKQQNEKQEVSE
jgi:hypothetical protein